MDKIKYFPLGIAKGEAFCNRVVERERLINNIKLAKHSIIISPRRYGKSSLVLYCLEELQMPYERVDLFVAVSAKAIEEQILRGVKKLISKLSSIPEQAVGYIKNYIKNVKSKWIVGTDGVNIELIPEQGGDVANTIMESLLMLEIVLRKKKLKAIFFIDEFQEMGLLENSVGIEGAIRHVAQESEYLNFIFSGSNRHILSNMFDNRTSPLYMLCDRISIDRIGQEDYIKYFDKISATTQQPRLSKDVTCEIFKLTERHPFYMNVLCDKLGIGNENKNITVEEVNIVWKEYILQEESKIAKELSGLNISQKKLLIAISRDINKDLMSKESLKKLNLSSAAIVKSLRLLEEQDYIHRNKNNEYSIIDPLIKASLITFYPADGY